MTPEQSRRYLNLARFVAEWMARRRWEPMRQTDIENLGAALADVDAVQGMLAGRRIQIDTATGQESVGQPQPKG